MYTINLDWLSCSVCLDRFNLESINQYYTVEQITGTQQFRKGLSICDFTGAKFRFYYENPLNAKLGQMVFDNSMFYGLDAKFSKIISEFCSRVGARFTNWQRIDICRDCDSSERFAGKKASDFLEQFASGKLKRLSRYSSSKITVDRNEGEDEKIIGGSKIYSSKRGEIETLYFTSKGCANAAKIYNKTREQKQSVYKPYIKKNWLVNDLNTEGDIFRFELTLQDFTGVNKGAYLGGFNIGQTLEMFDDRRNVNMLFLQEIERHFIIIDGIRRRQLFENFELSYNLYYVKLQKAENEILNTSPYTRGVLNYLKKLSLNRDLRGAVSQSQLNDLDNTILLLSKLQSNMVSRAREKDFAGSVSNTDPANFDNVFNHTLLTQKLNSANYKASNRCKIIDEETGEVVAYCNRNSLNLLTINSDVL